MIAVGGEALIDLVIQPDGSVAAKLGGGPFNAARTMARLGSDVAFLGTLSVDRFGRMLHRQLVDDDVVTSFGATVELPTTLAAAELDEGGAASYRFYLEGTSAPAMSGTTLPPNTRALHCGTLGFVLEPMATTLESMVASADDEVLVFVDPNCRGRVISDRAAYLARLDRVIGRADVVKISTDDAEYLDPSLTPMAVARRLRGLGPAVVILSDGGSATYVVTAAGETRVDVPKITVVDTIGAGDALGGGFLHWWTSQGFGRARLADTDLVGAAITAGVTVAARTCERAGAEPPYRRELPDDWAPELS